MSAASPQPQIGQLPSIGDPAALATQTRAFADQIFETVARAYLDFRRAYFHEANPSLTTPPPEVSDVHQTEAARLAHGALRIIPREAHAIPLVRDLMDQLQWVVDIHTLTDRERVSLHTLAMVFLTGIQGGIQAWFIEWLLQAGHALVHATHPDYYLAFPWEALLYKAPHELAAFDEAVRKSDIATLEAEIRDLGGALIKVLHDPLGTQPKLAFAGPDGRQRKLLFDLKTAAALALGAYLGSELVRSLINPQNHPQQPQSVIGMTEEAAQHVSQGQPARPGR